MVDNALLTSGLVVILAGIALILLGGAAVIAYQALQRRLDARAGVPAPGEEGPLGAPPAQHSSPGAQSGRSGAAAREHQPA